jgi:hypothetical protein
MVKAGRVIPKNELWLHRSPVAQELDRAIDWAKRHAPKASELKALERKLSKRRSRRHTDGARD